MSDLPAIVLDLDGVVLQTNFVKHSAMLSLFEVSDDQRVQISDYILSNGGVRRDLKIAHILRTFLKHSSPEDALPDYLRSYSLKLERELLAAPLVPGVKQFVEASGHTFYLSSSAPEREIELQLRARGLQQHFARTFGASTPKAQALSYVCASSSKRPVFFGDSVGDMQAAREARTPFVAVVYERDNFAGIPMTKLRDFTSLENVEHCIRVASRDAA